MNSERVAIARIGRRMRGGSQARLVLGDDNHWYVAKFAGNPQGTRTLVNEWVAYQLLKQLGVSTPKLQILHLTEELRSEDLYFEVGASKTPPQGTIHLGSQSPVDPETTSIFDFLPGKLLPKIVNLADFPAMFVFDQWVGQTDARQAIFVRDRSVGVDAGFRAYFIDHAKSFDGAEWRIRDAPRHGVYFRPEVYSQVDLNSLVENNLRLLEAITETSLRTAMDGVPSAWLAPGDRQSLAALLDSLQRRQPQMRSIVARHLAALDLPNVTNRTLHARV